MVKLRFNGLSKIIGFWIAGLLNNATYVVMNAGAKQINAGGVGLVYFANIFPTFMVKVTAPFWFHLISYRVKIITCAVLMLSCVLIVGLSSLTVVKLVGVGVGSLASAIGEASLLAFAAARHGKEKKFLTAWSSGTGFAGIFGDMFVLFWNKAIGLSFDNTSLIGSSFCVFWLLNYWFFLRKNEELAAEEDLRHRDDNGEIMRLRDTESQHSSFSSNEEVVEDGKANDSDNERLDTTEVKVGVESNSSESVDSDHARFENSKYKYINLSGSGGDELTFLDRCMIVPRLWIFTLPLFTVYAAEYIAQSGAWSVIGFPVTDAQSRADFYLYSNIMYQVGVFISRSSGAFCSIPKLLFWAMPVLQVLLMGFFILNGYEHLWWHESVLALAFVVGLIGGGVYVHGFIFISQHTRPVHRETAMACASVADTLGILTANLVGLIVQGCLYGANGITERPDFTCGYSYD